MILSKLSKSKLDNFNTYHFEREGCL